MLDNISKNRTYSILDTDLGVNSLTEADSGLYVTVAANTAYYINLMSSVESDGDGMRYNLIFTGTTGESGMIYTDTNLAVTSDFSVNNSYASAGLTKVFTAQGVLLTGSGGRLYLEVRKDTNAGGPSVIAAGAYLVAREI